MADEDIVHGQRGFHQPLLDLVTVQRRQRALFIPAHDVGVGIFAQDVSLLIVIRSIGIECSRESRDSARLLRGGSKAHA